MVSICEALCNASKRRARADTGFASWYVVTVVLSRNSNAQSFSLEQVVPQYGPSRPNVQLADDEQRLEDEVQADAAIEVKEDSDIEDANVRSASWPCLSLRRQPNGSYARAFALWRAG